MFAMYNYNNKISVHAFWNIHVCRSEILKIQLVKSQSKWKKKHQMQAHPTKSLETLGMRNTSDERSDESFIEIIKLCYLFTYHILKL